MNGWRDHTERCSSEPAGGCAVPDARAHPFEVCCADPGTVPPPDGCTAGEPAPEDPPDEVRAAKALFRLRFGQGWGCERCGHVRCTQLKTRPRVFTCNRCRHPFTVTAGTAFHRCRLPLVQVFAAARLLCRPRSISARALAAALGVGVETAWSLGHRLRSGFLDAPDVSLDGDDLIVTQTSFARRPSRGEPKPSRHDRARFVLLWNQSRRVVGLAGWPDPAGVRRFVDRHSRAERPAAAPMPMAGHPAVIGDGTHRGVSTRWLPMYVASIVGWTNGALDGRDPVALTLERGLRCRRYPFARLRPRPPLPLPPRDDAAVARVLEWEGPTRCGPVPLPSECACGQAHA